MAELSHHLTNELAMFPSKPQEIESNRKDSVSISITQTIVQTLHHLNIHNTDELLQQANINPELLEKTENRIDFDKQQNFWRIAIQAANDDSFPIYFALQSRLATFNMAGHVATNTQTMGESWDATQKYQQLAGVGGEVIITRNAHEIIMTYQPKLPNENTSDIRSCCLLASTINIGRWMIGEPYNPLRAEFSIAQPSDLQLFEDFFKCPIVFNQSANRVIFDRRIDDIRIPYASKELFYLMQKKADQSITNLKAHSEIEERVTHLIASNLINQEPDKNLIAEKLDISPRTLQRKLAKENTSYQEILDKTRYDLAQSYLHETQLTITDVAYMLGFTEPSAFYRAFKKWHGMTPGAYREKLHLPDEE
jgi:AraC-like DNA-binding protein